MDSPFEGKDKAVYLEDGTNVSADREAGSQDSLNEPVIDPVFEKRLVRKLDLLIMPVVTALYLFSAMDRGNLGNARLLGLIGPPKGLPADPTGSKYALLTVAFQTTYGGCMIPSALLARRVGKPYLCIAFAAAWWAIAACSSGAVQTWNQAYVTRFLLGVGEAAYHPNIPLMLAMMYTTDELALRISIFYCTGAFSGIINGLIAYGLTFTHDTVAPWRLLFIISGAPPFLLGAYALWSLPGRLLEYKRLTPAEREYSLARSRRRYKAEPVKIIWSQVPSILWSWQVLIPVLTNVCTILVAGVVSVFLPTLIQQDGYAGALAQVYTLPAYGTAWVNMLASAYGADRFKCRGAFIFWGFFLITLGGSILLGVPPPVTGVLSVLQRNVRYAACVFIANGVYVVIPLNTVWVADNSGNLNRRTVALPFFFCVPQMVAAAAGFLFPIYQAPTYTMGTAVCVAFGSFGCLITAAYMVLVYTENARRDRVEGKPDPNMVPDTANHADKAVGFRYIW